MHTHTHSLYLSLTHTQTRMRTRTLAPTSVSPVTQLKCVGLRRERLSGRSHLPCRGREAPILSFVVQSPPARPPFFCINTSVVLTFVRTPLLQHVHTNMVLYCKFDTCLQKIGACVLATVLQAFADNVSFGGSSKKVEWGDTHLL